MGRGRTDRSSRIITIPDVVGLTVADGTRAADNVGLVLTSADPNGPLVDPLTSSPQVRIIWQLPHPGSRRNRGEQILVGYEENGDGPAGVREPRRPPPNPLRAAASHHDEEPTPT